MMSSYSIPCNNKEDLFSIMTSVSQETSSNKRIYYQVIKGASFTGKDVLFDSYGYSYFLNMARSNGNNALWVCSMKNSTMLCDAAVQQDGSIFSRNQVTHIHAPRPNEYINIIIQRSLNTKIEQGFVRDFQEILNETFEEFKIPQFYVNGKWRSDLKKYFTKLKEENASPGNTESNFVSSFDTSNSSDEDEGNGNSYEEGNLSILGSVMRLISDTTFCDSSNTSYSAEATIPPSESESQESEVVNNIFNQLVETAQNFSERDLISSKPEDNPSVSESIAGDDYMGNFPHLKEATGIDPSDFMLPDVDRYGRTMTAAPDQQVNVIRDVRMMLPEDEDRLAPLLENGKEDASYLGARSPNQDSSFPHDHFGEQKKPPIEFVVEETKNNEDTITNVELPTEKEEPFETSPFNCVSFPKGPEDTLNITGFSDFDSEQPAIIERKEYLDKQDSFRGKGTEISLNAESQSRQEILINENGKKVLETESKSLLDNKHLAEDTTLPSLSEPSYEGENGCESQGETECPQELWEGKPNVSENVHYDDIVGISASEIPDKETAVKNQENEIETILGKENAELVCRKESSQNVSGKGNLSQNSPIEFKEERCDVSFCTKEETAASFDTKNTAESQPENAHKFGSNTEDAGSTEEKTKGNKELEDTYLQDVSGKVFPPISEQGVVEDTVVEKEINENNVSKKEQCLISVKKGLHSPTEETKEAEVKCRKKLKEETVSSNELAGSDGDSSGYASRKGFLGFPPQGKRKKEGEEGDEEDEVKSTSTKRSKSSPETCSDLVGSTLEDMFNDDENSSHSIIIGEAFTINEEQMKELEDTSDIDAKALKHSSSTLLECKNEEVEPSDDTAYSSNQSEEYSSQENVKGTLSTKEIKKEDADSPSKRPSTHQKPKKSKRSSFFKPVKKKKKSSKGMVLSSPVAAPPQRTHEILPAFLQELAGIDPALVIWRERMDEEGNRSRVACIALHETVLDWAFTDTMLSSFDSARTLRSRLSVPSKLNLLFPEEVDQRGTAFHPVQLGLDFPFSMPQVQGVTETTEEEARLPFPLEQFVLLCPSALGRRNALVAGGSLPLKTVTFADEPLEWAFKETFLSTFEDSPILSDLLGLDAATREWPDVAEEILAHEGVDHSFPFACPPPKKHLEGLLFHEFSAALPPTLLHETLQLPPLSPDLERRLFGERDALVRLLALASFYKHASCIPTVRSNRKLSVSHAALVASFRPMIISQANSLAFVIREARVKLLNGVTCQDPSIIPALIRGPVPSKRGFLFANVHKLEAAVAKDPNNKLQYI